MRKNPKNDPIGQKPSFFGQKTVTFGVLTGLGMGQNTPKMTEIVFFTNMDFYPLIERAKGAESNPGAEKIQKMTTSAKNRAFLAIMRDIWGPNRPGNGSKHPKMTENRFFHEYGLLPLNRKA